MTRTYPLPGDGEVFACRPDAAAPRFVLLSVAGDGTRFFWDHSARAWTTDASEATTYSPQEQRGLRGAFSGEWVCAACGQGDPTRRDHVCR